MTKPLLLTQKLAEATGAPSDIRVGTVAAVTSRGIDVALADGLIRDAGHLTSYNPAVGDPVTMISYANSWVVLGRVLGPGTPTDNASPGLGLGLTILDGCVLSGTGNDMALSTGSLVAVPRYGVSFFHPPTHWVMLLFSFSWYSTVAGDVVQVRLVEAGGTAYSVDNQQVVGGIGNFATMAFMVDPTLGAAARSWSATVQRIGGSGTSRVYDPTARRGSLVAYDLGASSIIRTV